MSIYLPPLARKKRVSGRHRHDTYDILGDFQSVTDHGTSYRKQFTRHNEPPSQLRATSSSRKHKPQPTSMTFLSKNPRFICEPICHAKTQQDSTQSQPSWWPADENLSTERPTPHYSRASTQRSDFRGLRSVEPIESQIWDGKNMQKKEKISFRHQYDSRRMPNEHERGKLHGAFIWADVPVRSRATELTPVTVNQQVQSIEPET